MTPEWKVGVRGGRLHRVHGAARSGAYRARRQDLLEGLRRFQEGYRTQPRGARPRQRPARGREKEHELEAMRICADALIAFAARHAGKARELALAERDPARKAELERVAEICERVPAHPPRDFHEALQYYWFTHLGVTTELNTWDAFNPGHLDRHLLPFYRKGIEEGTLTRERAEELLQCFWIKFNNQPAPPKVGVTAEESGTYTDFAQINTGGVNEDGSDGVSELTFLMLDVIEEMRLLQPSSSIQVSEKSPDAFVERAARIIRTGFGQPSVFNADIIVRELVRQGKSLADARAGGSSGCVEVGAFGKESYILTGYFNMPKVLEITLANGVDPRTGRENRARDGRRGRFRVVRRAVRRVREAAPPFRRHQDPRERRDREALRSPHAGAVSLDSDRRLRREGHGLQRRRRAIRHELHPGGRSRHDHRLHERDQASRLRREIALDGAAPGGSRGRLRRRGEAPPDAPQPDPALRQRRRPRRRYHAAALRRVFRRDRREAEHERRRLPHQPPADDRSYLLRAG